MKRFRFTIGNKILGGFLILIVIFAINAIISITTIWENGGRIRENAQVLDPSVSKLNNLNHLVTRSKMLITNWVYMYGNQQDKQKLDSLQNVEYPVLRSDLKELSRQWSNVEQKNTLDTVFIRLDEIFALQRREVMEKLNSFEDYEDLNIKLFAEEELASNILPQMSKLQKKLEVLIQAKMKEKDQASAEQISSFETLSSATLLLAVVVIVLGFIIALIITRNITGPVTYMKEIVNKLSKGILPEESKRRFSNDEIGEMALALEKLVVGLKSTSSFAESIGNGKYDAHYEPLSKEDVLGNSLLEMRDNLHAVAEKDKRRNWATEGLAKFGEILRKNNDNINNLSDIILSNLVKYIGANQGGIYIVSEAQEEEPYLEMAACYAWDKKKYVEQKVYAGEGLSGQAWIEKETIYLTDVPEDYITITSGLGEATPNCILIVPLKVNDEIYGLIEVASFNQFEDYQIEFVEKIAESIASTLSSVKINERTQRLLEDSQQLTEQMRAQEEEMRQNMEELQATQEEMERTQHERKEKEHIINSTNMMIELSEAFQINLVNNTATQLLGYREDELRNLPLGKLLSSGESLAEVRKMLEEGHIWNGILHLRTKKGEELIVKAAAGRMRDTYSNKPKYLIFAANITSVVQKHEQE